MQHNKIFRRAANASLTQSQVCHFSFVLICSSLFLLSTHLTKTTNPNLTPSTIEKDLTYSVFCKNVGRFTVHAKSLGGFYIE